MIHKWISRLDLVFIPNFPIMWMQMLQHLKECKIQNVPLKRFSSDTQAVPGRWSWATVKGSNTRESLEARVTFEEEIREIAPKERPRKGSIWEETCAVPLRAGRTGPGRFREQLQSRVARAKRTWCGCRSFTACSVRILNKIVPSSFSFILHRIYKSTNPILRETPDLYMWFFNNSLSNLY